jgi:hypothetical protein
LEPSEIFYRTTPRRLKKMQQNSQNRLNLPRTIIEAAEAAVAAMTGTGEAFVEAVEEAAAAPATPWACIAHSDSSVFQSSSQSTSRPRFCPDVQSKAWAWSVLPPVMEKMPT